MNRVIVLKEIDNNIKSPYELFNHIKKIDIDYNQENLLLFTLNTRNQIINVHVLFKGGLNETTIDLRTLFRIALKDNSCNIIIAHNHPSGTLKPSDVDKKVYERIKQAGSIIGLRCLGSVIFNETEYYAMN